MTAEMHAVRLSGTVSATVRCDDCEHHADAYDVERVHAVMSDATMHAMSEGHTVQGYTTRSLTITPEPLWDAADISYSVYSQLCALALGCGGRTAASTGWLSTPELTTSRAPITGFSADSGPTCLRSPC